ncbi:protein of unknown function [Acetoanaerobium noterae]|jgi:uncharacterized protein YnzC (UPF0291/DUF896 family)|uniref:UPF0291 protein CLOST_1931 n=2 Tax=Acetoanaerobium TaxID=186831 RepID=E3PT47_ACESD|nr:MULTISPECIES: DUF896 domain-containing protein [Acetoanaerobium]MBP8763246.1 DUF896 domain-containing protein [Acetoanaerobium sp.]MDK2803023.1 hypothetical protein [Peptostreptococcaceae bacterium]MBP9499491.1 DUF896 domain-containing protein [Acetoanaerobium sp.]MBP9562516.1 DUF896 domain-containing protein [Acetoanaerobium sp.]CBH22051.1 conserved protein of unknown function [Acetoanaerobium sticklandii]
MSEEELVKRINFLSKKSKQEGLNDIEKQEQKNLRQEYVNRFKNNLRQQLDSIKIQKN